MAAPRLTVAGRPLFAKNGLLGSARIDDRAPSQASGRQETIENMAKKAMWSTLDADFDSIT
jgi:hypothetical protein